MRLGIDIGIDPQGDFGRTPHALGDFRETVQFRLGFDVEGQYFGLERQRHFALGLADTRKGDA